MTDEQVIKAFECCTKIEEGSKLELCFECPMFEEDVDECTASLFGKVLDLIKRQQAEIERLKEHNHILDNIRCESWERISELDRLNENIRAKAIKEFAERVKAHMCDYDFDNYHYFTAIEEEVFDDLVKELTEGSK